MRAIIGLAIAVAAGQAALAHEARVSERYSEAYNACSDAAQSTADFIQCAGAEFERQDAALNLAYRKAMEGLTPGQQEKLRAAQRAWIAFRDTHCRSLEDPDWGSMSRIFANHCMVDETIERLVELEQYPPV